MAFQKCYCLQLIFACRKLYTEAPVVGRFALTLGSFAARAILVKLPSGSGAGPDQLPSPMVLLVWLWPCWGLTGVVMEQPCW